MSKFPEPKVVGLLATLPYAPLPCSQQSACSPTQPCTPTPASSPPVVRPPLPRSNVPVLRQQQHQALRRIFGYMGFDLNENWQEDREHYDNQKIHGLTLPKVIRTSAFTARLDIEGCDPLALPVAALLVEKVDMDAVIFSLMEVPEAQTQIAPSSHKVRIEVVSKDC